MRSSIVRSQVRRAMRLIRSTFSGAMTSPPSLHCGRSETRRRARSTWRRARHATYLDRLRRRHASSIRSPRRASILRSACARRAVDRGWFAASWLCRRRARVWSPCRSRAATRRYAASPTPRRSSRSRGTGPARLARRLGEHRGDLRHALAVAAGVRRLGIDCSGDEPDSESSSSFCSRRRIWFSIAMAAVPDNASTKVTRYRDGMLAAVRFNRQTTPSISRCGLVSGTAMTV